MIAATEENTVGKIIEKSPVKLDELVREEIKVIEPVAIARHVSFNLKLAKDIPKMLLDDNKIRQVIMNLADNAVYYSPENSKILVSLEKVGHNVKPCKTVNSQTFRRGYNPIYGFIHKG